MNHFFAQPYDTSATGFYFETFAEYESKVAALLNSYGLPVEEFEIQFIDGDDAQLFSACSIDQGNIEKWFDEVEGLDDNEKISLFYIMDNAIVDDIGEALSKLDDVSIYHGGMKEAADDLFDEIYLHDVPEAVRNYIDYDAFANDCKCGGDMVEFEYDGNTYTCTNASSI